MKRRGTKCSLFHDVEHTYKRENVDEFLVEFLAQ